MRSSLNHRRDLAQRELQTLQSLQHDWREGERLHREQTATRQQFDAERHRLKTLETEGRQAAERLKAAESEDATIRAQIEAARAARSESVEQLRQYLREDEPCPVCGGTDHPFRHAPPAHPGVAMIEAIERQERQRLEGQRQQVERAQQTYHQCSADYRACRQGMQERERQLETLSRQLDQARAAIDAHDDAPALRRSESADGWFETRRERLNRQWQEASDRLAALDDAERLLQPLEADWQRLSLELGKLDRLFAAHRKAISDLALSADTDTSALKRIRAQLDAMAEHPILIERPFVVTSKGTRLARPLDNVREIL